VKVNYVISSKKPLYSSIFALLIAIYILFSSLSDEERKKKGRRWWLSFIVQESGWCNMLVIVMSLS